MEDSVLPPPELTSLDAPYEAPSPALEEFKIVRLSLLFEGGLVVVAIVIGLFMTTPPWKLIRWRFDSVIWGLVATVPLLAGLFAIRRIHSGPVGRLNSIVDRLLVPLFTNCSLAQLAIISLVAGVGEEMLFRGVLQPLAIDWLGKAAGLILASAAFGMCHAITRTYALLAALVGVYFGGLAIASENLLGPIIAHALYDFLALIILTRGFTPPADSHSIDHSDP